MDIVLNKFLILKKMIKKAFEKCLHSISDHLETVSKTKTGDDYQTYRRTQRRKFTITINTK